MSKHSPIRVVHKGSFDNTERFMNRNRKKALKAALNRLGQRGVDALAAATPVRTGKTAASWRFEVVEDGSNVYLQWHNDNETSTGDNIVKMLIRGHGTRDGHYVRGRDFVTPAIQPIFDEIADKAWMEVNK